MKSLIYLASPYSSPDRKVMDRRFREITKIGAKLISEGKHIFGPITESHSYGKYGGVPNNWDFWSEHDKLMIDKCDELYVVMLYGWKESTGVTEEIEYAMSKDMPITYVDPKKYLT